MKPGTTLAIVYLAAATVLCAFLLGAHAGKDGKGFDPQPKAQQTTPDNESIVHTAQEWDFGNPPIKAMEADMVNVRENLKTAWGLTNIHIKWHANSGLMEATGILPNNTVALFIGRWDGAAWAYEQMEAKK
jgi:hypothetical protein